MGVRIVIKPGDSAAELKLQEALNAGKIVTNRHEDADGTVTVSLAEAVNFTM